MPADWSKLLREKMENEKQEVTQESPGNIRKQGEEGDTVRKKKMGDSRHRSMNRWKPKDMKVAKRWE